MKESKGNKCGLPNISWWHLFTNCGWHLSLSLQLSSRAILLDHALVSKLWSTSHGIVINAWIVNCNFNDILINCIYFVWAMQPHLNSERLSVHFPLRACLITKPTWQCEFGFNSFPVTWSWKQSTESNKICRLALGSVVSGFISVASLATKF